MVELTQRSWWPTWLPPAGVRETIPLVVIVGYLFCRGDRTARPGHGRANVACPRAPEPRNVLVGAAMPAAIALRPLG